MKNIVIIGAGFGGIRAAKKLARAIKKMGLLGACAITLIDKNDYHTYTPTLYEVATTSKETAQYLDLKRIVTFPVKTIIGSEPIKFIRGEISELHLPEQYILCTDGNRIPFDYLVLATGAETNFYNIPGLKENSFTLRTFPDAIRIRENVLNVIGDRGANAHVLVGGGGSTGVELASELKHWRPELQITLVQGGKTILPQTSKQVIKKITQRMEKMGIRVLTNHKIISAKKTSVEVNIDDSIKTLSYDMLIWAGGNTVSDVLRRLPAKTEVGRMAVTQEMICVCEGLDLELSKRVLGIGDITCFYHPEKKQMIPGVARAAIEQGDIAAKNIAADIAFQEKIITTAPRFTYHPKEYPYVIPVGGKYAVAHIGKFTFCGFSGWFLKGIIELNYLFTILPPTQALRIWFKGLSIFIRNRRIG